MTERTVTLMFELRVHWFIWRNGPGMVTLLQTNEDRTISVEVKKGLIWGFSGAQKWSEKTITKELGQDPISITPRDV